MEESIRKRLTIAISEKVFPGCVVGMIDSAGKRSVIPMGKFTYRRDAPDVVADTIYDVASVTKSIPVSCLVLELIDQGKISLDDKIVDYLPELQHMRFSREVLIHHYLTMTLDYHIPLSSLREKKPEEILESIFTTQFRYRPGEKMNYSNAASIVLGLLIERVTGKKLDVLADERFFRPLRMMSTTFYPEKVENSRIAPTENDPWRKRVIQGEIHDETAFILREKMIAGSAGLFSTVPDLLSFLQMLLQKGIYKKRRYFSEKIIDQMATNQLSEEGEYTGLGWELCQPRFMGKSCTKHTIGKTGFTGCVVICDVPKGRGMVLLSNYHYPNRKKSFDAINAVRRYIAEIII